MHDPPPGSRLASRSAPDQHQLALKHESPNMLFRLPLQVRETRTRNARPRRASRGRASAAYNDVTRANLWITRTWATCRAAAAPWLRHPAEGRPLATLSTLSHPGNSVSMSRLRGTPDLSQRSSCSHALDIVTAERDALGQQHAHRTASSRGTTIIATPGLLHTHTSYDQLNWNLELHLYWVASARRFRCTLRAQFALRAASDFTLPFVGFPSSGCQRSLVRSGDRWPAPWP